MKFTCIKCVKKFELYDRAMYLWSENVGLVPTAMCVWCWEIHQGDA